MKCTNCRAEFEEGTLFCPKCGKEIQWVPEYNTLETLIRQKEQQEQERKKKAQEMQKEKERLQRRAEQEKRKKKKKTIILAGSVLAVTVLAVTGIFFAYQKQNNSFDFQLAQAETKFSNKAYEDALKYVERALAIQPDSAETNVLEAKIYLKEGKEETALAILTTVVENNPDSTSAYGELLRLYEKNEEYDKIRELMNQANSKIQSAYQGYVCELPDISVNGGTYKAETDIRFLNLPEGTEVYYTLDGSEPTMDSEKYQDTITLETEGSTVLKYIAYNSKMIPSEVGEETYTLQFEAPEKPVISPNSDKYDYQEMIIVTAQDGCDIYYAFDTEPTIDSEKYTGPIAMPEGEHTFSAIAVDSRGKISKVSSALYVYYGE